MKDKKKAIELFESANNMNVHCIYNKNYHDFSLKNTTENPTNGLINFLHFFQGEKKEEDKKLISHPVYIRFSVINFTEIDFINEQLSVLEDLTFDNLIHKKQYSTYLNFLTAKKNEIETRNKPIKLDPNQPTKNLDLMIGIFTNFFQLCRFSTENDLSKTISKKKRITRLNEIVENSIVEIKNRINQSNFNEVAEYYVTIMEHFYTNFKTELIPKDSSERKVSVVVLNRDILNPIKDFIYTIKPLLGNEKTNHVNSLTKAVDLISTAKEIVESESLKEFEKESSKVQEDWQNYESMHRTFEDRLELDIEAFINKSHNDKYSDSSDFVKEILIERLINNIEKSETKHHYWMGYLKFLRAELDTDSNANKENKSTKIKFDPLIFKDQPSFDLFLFLVDEYAINKQPKQFSQIFHWMQENGNSIKPSTGKRYRRFVKEMFKDMPAKYSRIEPKKPFEMPALNDIKKRFP